MAFQKGKSGNPGGRRREKLFLDALTIAVKAEAEPNKTKLRAIAEKLVEEAVAGEGWAIQQVADRLDGKPQQSIDANITDDRDLSDLSGAELIERFNGILERLEGSGAVQEGNTGSAEGEDKSSDLRQLN